MHYYQHHIGDFIKDTANLNDHQLATYLRMLWAYYDTEAPISVDIEDVSFAMRSDEKTVRLLLRHYFHEKDDGWHHTRCDRELSDYREKSEKARSSATARWKNASAKQTQSIGNANDAFSDANQEPRTTNQEPPTRKDKTRKPRPQSDDFVSVDDLVAEGVDAQVAKDWLRVRKDKQQRTLTKTAWATVKAESVKAGMALDESLREAVARGWAGFKASWLDKASPPGRQPQPSKHTGFDSKDYSAGADEHGIIV